MCVPCSPFLTTHRFGSHPYKPGYPDRRIWFGLILTDPQTSVRGDGGVILADPGTGADDLVSSSRIPVPGQEERNLFQDPFETDALPVGDELFVEIVTCTLPVLQEAGNIGDGQL
jgi:hypothetical protein